MVVHFDVVFRAHRYAWLCSRMIAALLLASLFTPNLSAAQAPTDGAIRGIVQDEQGVVLAGVNLTAKSPETALVFTAQTDDTGSYRLLNLPPGFYRVTADLQGFSSVSRDDVFVRAGLNLALDLTMKVGSVSESVHIAADTPLLESSSAAQSFNVTGNFQRAVPLSAGRYWHDFLAVIPGTVNSELGNQPYLIHGASFASHVIQMDGADLAPAFQSTNVYVNFSNEILEDVQVKVGGVDASAPLGNGAVINMVTKSGTNDMRGTASFSARARSWNANNNPGGTTTDFESVQPDVSFGGPVLRDRAWFFGAYRYRYENRGISRSPIQLSTLQALVPGFKPFDNETRAHYSFVKANAAPSTNHQAQFFYQRDRFPQTSSTAQDAGAFFGLDTGGDAFGGRLSSVWNPTLTTRLSVSYNNKTQSTKTDGAGPNSPVHMSTFLSSGRLQGTGALATLHNRAQATHIDSTKLTVALDADYVHRDRSGSHDFQAGIFLQPHQGIAFTTQYSNSGFAIEELVLRNPSDYSAGTIPFHQRIYATPTLKSLDVTHGDTGMYVQDAWRPIARITVNAGVRVDLVRRRDNIFAIETQRSTEIGPRFGVNYLLDQAGRHSARATWNRVHDIVSTSRITTGTATASFRDAYDTNLDGVFDAVFETPGSTAQTATQTVDPNYRQPFTDEWTVGYRHQAAGQISVEANVVHRAFKDRPTSIETNGLYENGVFRGYRNEAFNDMFLFTNDTYNTPIYNAVEIVATKQTRSVQFVTSYTRQWRHISGTWQPNDPASFIQPQAFPNDKGLGAEPASSDSNSLSGTGMTGSSSARDHLFRLALAYRGPWNIMFATNYTYQSALWMGPTIDRLAAPDPQFGPATVTLSNGRVVSNPLSTLLRFVGPTRSDNQTKLPATHVWNVRAGRLFSLGAVSTIELAVDVFNIPNLGSEQFYIFGQTNQRFSPNFGKGDQRQLPRSAQAFIRLTF
jgi:hypothetical protein